MTKGNQSSTLVRFDEFELDIVKQTLVRNGAPIKLQAQPLRLLTLLASRAGEIVSHQEIYDHLWGDQQLDHAGGAHVCIRQIRAVLEDNAAAPKYIENVPRRGYRFIAEKAAAPTLPAALRMPARSLFQRPFLAGALAVFAVGAAIIVTDAPSSRQGPVALIESPGQDSFLRGRYLLDLSDTDSVEKSRDYFARSIEADPEFAPAYSAMAEAFQRTGEFANGAAYAEKAAALDPKLADAQLRLGAVQFFQHWDWNAAERYFENALALDPDFVEAHQAIATVYSVTGRLDAALKHMEIALSLDPASTLLNADYGYFLYYAGKYEAAAKQCDDALKLAPADTSAMHCRIKVARQMGDLPTAAKLAADYMRFWRAQEESIEQLSVLSPDEAMVFFEDWRLSEAKKQSAAVNGDISPERRAFYHVASGDFTEAMEQLAIARENRSQNLPVLLLDPELTPLHEEHAFQSLLNEMHITVASASSHASL